MDVSVLFAELESLYPTMVDIRRDLHQHPELSFEEVRTPQFIAEYLQNLGIEVRTGVGGRGVVGLLRGGKPGKTVALRADFDALPIQDEKDAAYKSQVPGVMHACGHDGHTASLLGVATVLANHREELQGNVVFIHQFAEELAPGGAKPMIEDGCLDGVDAIFGAHLSSPFPVGEIYYREGYIMAASDRFEIEILGKGGHGASPHQTVDSLVTASQLVLNLQTIVSRRVDPLKPAVVSVGSLHAGEAFNVIPDRAKLIGTVRTYDDEVRELIKESIEQVTAATCGGAGAAYTFKYEYGYDAVWNHPNETKHLVRVAKEIVGEEAVKEVAPQMGAEDFAYYLQKVPGTFFFTGARNPEWEIAYPHHHPKFDIDERALLIASKVLAASAVLYLEEEACKLNLSELSV